MKENSIEEEIKIALDKFLDNKDKDSAILIVEKFILENYILRGGRTNIVKDSLRYILSDYKGVLKENEELLQEKINNQKIIALAQNNMLNYQAGFEDGKNRRTSAVQSIIENQQYYIFQKQIEKYERHIEKLQKENEELNYKLHSKKITLEIYNRYIPKSKVEEIIDRIDYDIKKTKEIISNNSKIYTSERKNNYQIVRLKAMITKSLEIKNRLQELLKESEN